MNCVLSFSRYRKIEIGEDTQFSRKIPSRFEWILFLNIPYPLPEKKKENHLNYLANEEGVQNTIFSIPPRNHYPPPDQHCNFLALFMHY